MDPADLWHHPKIAPEGNFSAVYQQLDAVIKGEQIREGEEENYSGRFRAPGAAGLSSIISMN